MKISLQNMLETSFGILLGILFFTGLVLYFSGQSYIPKEGLKKRYFTYQGY